MHRAWARTQCNNFMYFMYFMYGVHEGRKWINGIKSYPGRSKNGDLSEATTGRAWRGSGSPVGNGSEAALAETSSGRSWSALASATATSWRPARTGWMSGPTFPRAARTGSLSSWRSSLGAIGTLTSRTGVHHRRDRSPSHDQQGPRLQGS